MADIITFLRTSDCHGMYLAGITRVERVLPLLPGSKARLGDVLRLFGKPEDVARAAHLLGEAKAPDTVTGFVYLGGGLMVGILIGMVTVPLAGAALSLLPPLASLYIGRFLLHIEPAILRGAIAGQHAGTPAINATEAVAGNPVLVIGYTVTYAIANILLPLLGPIFVAAFAATHAIAL
ncbi:MAG: hypothetical protein P4L98_16470 [Ancalomicrobiaceae bacterium]|nr:hypothetical protein [Ancalomicrobiaceae bacterium]